MKPLRLWARNLRTWADLDLEIPDGIAAVVGPNGAGKSSAVSVIDLALFAPGRELKRMLTREGLDDTVEVGLDFEHAGQVYRVTRSYQVKGAGKPRLDLALVERIDVTGFQSAEPQHLEAPKSLNRETVGETQADLEELLGLTRQTFRASSYLAQGDGAAFTQADPRDRKGIILDALGVRVWDRLHEQARTLRREAEDALTVLLAAVETAEGQVALRDAVVTQVRAAEQERGPAELAVVDLERGLTEARKTLEEGQEQEAESALRRERAAQARARCVEVEERAALLRLRTIEVPAGDGSLETVAAWLPLLEQAATLQAQADEKSRAATHLEQLEAQHLDAARAATVRVDGLIEQVGDLEHERLRLDVEGGTCPTCEQPLAGKALEKARDALRARLTAVESDRDAMLAQAQEAAKRAEEVGRSLAERNGEVTALLAEALNVRGEVPEGVTIDQCRRAARELDLRAERAVHAEQARADLAEVEAKLPDLAKAADDAEAAAAELLPIDLDVVRRRIADAEARLTEARERVRTADAKVARAQAEVDRLDTIAEALVEQRAELATLQENVATLRRAEVAFGRDGVPALILEAQAIPQLEAEATRIIEELGRPYRFTLRTQRETQSGTVREALDIVVTTETGEALYEDFSGGERTRLDLALRIALARLLAARRGADVRVLIVDEPAFLDADGFEQLATVLRRLAPEFESVLVVSHEEALRDAFDSAIVVAGGADTGEPSRLEEA